MILLGASLIVLFYAFGRGMFSGGTTTASVKTTPTPRKQASGKSESKTDQLKMPSPEDQVFQGETTPIVYRPGAFGVPSAGRNIFAFLRAASTDTLYSDAGTCKDAGADPDADAITYTIGGDKPAECLRRVEWLPDGDLRRQIYARYKDLYGPAGAAVHIYQRNADDRRYS